MEEDKINKILLAIVMIAAVFSLIVLVSAVTKNSQEFYKKPAIMVIDIDGEIISSSFGGIYEKRGKDRKRVTSARDVVRTLEYFSKDESIKAFILEIDAQEGQNSGQEEIVRMMKRLDKPVLTVIKGKAFSAGYYVASGGDKVYAHPDALIGNIGYTFVEVNRNRESSEQECLLSSKSYKLISPNCRGFAVKEVNKLKAYVNITHEITISAISQNRNISKEFLEEASRRSNITASEALSIGLIDEIGTTHDAVDYLEQKTGERLWLIYLRDMLPPDQVQK